MYNRMLGLVLGSLALLLVAANGLADTPRIKSYPDAEKDFATKAGTAVLKATRTKPTKIAYLKHEFSHPKANRTELNVKLEYYGAAIFRNKRFVADITLIIDSSDKKNPEVLNIRYTDTNPTPSPGSEARRQALIKEFNR